MAERFGGTSVADNMNNEINAALERVRVAAMEFPFQGEMGIDSAILSNDSVRYSSEIILTIASLQNFPKLSRFIKNPAWNGNVKIRSSIDESRHRKIAVWVDKGEAEPVEVDKPAAVENITMELVGPALKIIKRKLDEQVSKGMTVVPLFHATITKSGNLIDKLSGLESEAYRKSKDCVDILAHECDVIGAAKLFDSLARVLGYEASVRLDYERYIDGDYGDYWQQVNTQDYTIERGAESLPVDQLIEDDVKLREDNSWVRYKRAELIIFLPVEKSETIIAYLDLYGIRLESSDQKVSRYISFPKVLFPENYARQSIIPRLLRGVKDIRLGKGQNYETALMQTRQELADSLLEVFNSKQRKALINILKESPAPR
jgi:hypothetical protein